MNQKQGKNKKRCLGGILLLLLIFAGCGKEAQETVEPHGKNRFAPIVIENVAVKNLAGILQEETGSIVVQIRTEYCVGSGVLWEITETEMILITAGHVLEGAESLNITFRSVQKEEEEEVTVALEGAQWELRQWESCDLGLIRIPLTVLPDILPEHCMRPAVERSAFDHLKNGDALVVVGSDREAAGSAFEGTLTDPWIYMEDYEQYMMLAHTYARPGMSGGAVFQENGCLVGILSGADQEGNLAMVPLPIILTELEAMDLWAE